MPGRVTTGDNGQKRSNSYMSAPTNGTRTSNGYSSKNKYYQSNSKNEKYNNSNKSSININDPNDWPSLGEATITASNEITSTINTANSKTRLANNSSAFDTNGTAFKSKKIVQTKNTSTPNGDVVETTVIEETDTFSKLVISKEPSNHKDTNNNNKIVLNGNGNSVHNDNESSTETSSSGGNLDDSIDVLDDKENSSSVVSSVSKKSSSNADEVETTDDKQASKSKKKSSKSKWKVLNIEQLSKSMMERRRDKYERRDRDHYREDRRDRERDSRPPVNGARRRDYTNSNGKYGESNDGYYASKGTAKYSNSGYYHSSGNYNSSSNHHSKDSQTTHSTANGVIGSKDHKNISTATCHEDKVAVSNNTNASGTTTNDSSNSTSSMLTTTTQTPTQQQSSKSFTNNTLSNHSYSNSYSNGASHRQRHASGSRKHKSNRSISGYRQHRNGVRMHYDSGNVTPLSDYDYNTSNGYYYENGHYGHHQQMSSLHHQQQHQVNVSNGSLSQNGYVQPRYYAFHYSPTTLSTPVGNTGMSVKSWANLENILRTQIEYYFSEANLQGDFFLRRKMDKEGYLPISLIASFHRVQALTLNVKDIIDSLKKSDKIELSDDNKKVRPKNEPSKWPIMDQLFSLNSNMFDFGKGSTSSSLASKDASTDSANDSRTSGVSFGSTDLHPNVPEFIPGQPYGYSYDGANTCVYYPPTSFENQYKPSLIENSYALNCQMPSNGNAYLLNATPSLTASSNDADDSKTMDNCNVDDEIVDSAISEDKHRDASGVANSRSTETQETHEVENVLQNGLTNITANDQKSSEVVRSESNQVPQYKQTDSSKVVSKKQSTFKQIVKGEKVKEQKVESRDNQQVSKKDESNKSAKSNKSQNTSTTLSNNVVEKSSNTTKCQASSKENLFNNKENSQEICSVSAKNTTPSVQPAKILSYSDAIKLKEKPSTVNKQVNKDEHDKKENDLTNMKPSIQFTNVTLSTAVTSVAENQKENRRERQKSSSAGSTSSNQDSFHGFKSAKSNRNRTFDKK